MKVMGFIRRDDFNIIRYIMYIHNNVISTAAAALHTWLASAAVERFLSVSISFDNLIEFVIRPIRVAHNNILLLF